MVLDPAQNFVRGTVDSSVGQSDTTISVSNASIYPDPSTQGNYNLVIWDDVNYKSPNDDPDVEIIRVTGRDTNNNNLTVTRGEESTTAVSHPSGSVLHLSPTAKMFSDIETTFSNFWDENNSELTADVNNTSVSTDEGNINDSATDPSTNGELRRNGVDVKVYSGGAVKNMSNIGSGGGADDSRVQMFARRRITE